MRHVLELGLQVLYLVCLIIEDDPALDSHQEGHIFVLDSLLSLKFELLLFSLESPVRHAFILHGTELICMSLFNVVEAIATVAVVLVFTMVQRAFPVHQVLFFVARFPPIRLLLYLLRATHRHRRVY